MALKAAAEAAAAAAAAAPTDTVAAADTSAACGNGVDRCLSAVAVEVRKVDIYTAVGQSYPPLSV